MPLATKNNAIIIKDGRLAENCNCCGGWYCFTNVCECPSIKGVTVSISSSDNRFTYPGDDFIKVRGSLVSGTHTLSLASTWNNPPNSNFTGIVKYEAWVAWPYTLQSFGGGPSLGILDPAGAGGYLDAHRQDIASASAGRTPGIVMTVGYTSSGRVTFNRIDVLVLVLTAVGPLAQFDFGDKYGFNEIVPDNGNPFGGGSRQSQSGVQRIVQFPLGCVPPHGSPNTLKVLVQQAPNTLTLFSETDVTLNSIVFQT
jgi:hypothetical protein